MPGQKKLMVFSTQAYGGTGLDNKLYTCDAFEFQGTWLVMRNCYDGKDFHTSLSINQAVRVEER